MTARDHGRMIADKGRKADWRYYRVVSVTQDVNNLGSFIMFLGLRRNPQTHICPLKAIKHVDTARDLGIVLTKETSFSSCKL